MKLSMRRLFVPLALGWLLLATPLGAARLHAQAVSVSAAELKSPELIAKGKYLTTAGDCAACHTEQGGQAFAGGHLMPTPFGTIPSPNITPDRETGLGDWSFDDFWRALHSGKGKRGEYLYPTFSYTSFTKVTRDDAKAIYAYLMSLAPVSKRNKPLGLGFPYNIRTSLLGWRLLYFNEGVYQPDPKQSAQWNRGAYLVQGLGHCNECHAARNALGGTSGKNLGGGEIPQQNWYAPDLSTQNNGGLDGWSEADIVALLKTGNSPKGTAFGPMAEVVADSTQYMTEEDLKAIASYLRSLPARPVFLEEKSPFDVAAIAAQGQQVYEQRCAECHGKDGNGHPGVYPPLNGNSSVNEPTGVNASRVVLLGGFPPTTQANPRPYSMPPFAQQLSDTEVSAVVTYIRQAWGNRAAPVIPADINRYRNTPVD